MPRGSFVSRPADFGQPADAQVDQFATTGSMSENLRSLTLDPAPNLILLVLVLVLVFFPEVPAPGFDHLRPRSQLNTEH